MKESLERHQIEMPSEVIHRFAQEYVSNKKASSSEDLDLLDDRLSYAAGMRQCAIILSKKIQRLEDQIEALQREVERLTFK